MDTCPALRADAQRILEQVEESLRRLVPPAELGALLEQCRLRFRYQPYHALPAVRQALVQLGQKHGQSTQAQVMQWLLARLVLDFGVDKLDYKVTESVRELYRTSQQRILATPPDRWCLDDRFFKDLALARGDLFPAGERVVEPCSVLQRALLYRSGPGQALRFARATLRAKGTRPVFRLHVHLSEAPRLSKATWRQTCEYIVEMLKINPGVKGVVGASWFYDPELPGVSPRLAFINDQLRAGGARWFFSHVEGGDSGAFARSESRKAAFETGRYIPRCYAVFWPRRDALAWLGREGGV